MLKVVFFCTAIKKLLKSSIHVISGNGKQLIQKKVIHGLCHDNERETKIQIRNLLFLSLPGLPEGGLEGASNNKQ